ncbi:MAG: ribonuclease P protein component [Victivallales bacterium]|nr:ribonuclease P protein component [Victivallales bacterium]
MSTEPCSAASPFGVDSRLHCRQQIDAVKNGGTSQVCRYSVIVVLKAPPDGQRRAAFLISRRFDLRAVVRNRARRLFRESWRQLFPRLQDCWVLLIPRRAIKKACCQQVLRELESVLTKQGVCLPASEPER